MHPGTSGFDEDDRMVSQLDNGATFDNIVQVKQTYSVYVCDQQSRASGSPRKWHLSEYMLIMQAILSIYQTPSIGKPANLILCL